MPGLLRRTLLRGAPLWGLWTWAACCCCRCICCLSSGGQPGGHRISLRHYAGGHGTGLRLRLLVSWYLFAYLYNTRTAYHYGSLPLRRETQFLTRYLADCCFIWSLRRS